MRGRGLPQPSHRWALAAASLPLRARPAPPPPRPSGAGGRRRDLGGGRGTPWRVGEGRAAPPLRPGPLPRRAGGVGADTKTRQTVKNGFLQRPAFLPRGHPPPLPPATAAGAAAASPGVSRPWEEGWDRQPAPEPLPSGWKG